jgi:HAE1 family hydrophobic/amphiphilic exporter-1
MKDSAAAVKAAFLSALVALFMILAAQFESLSQPAVIMVSAPLSFVGAFAALALTGVPMSIFAQIGLVALMGIVMKNGILLVDCANARRGESQDARAAMLAAGPERLRPVLMTAFSTIAGMIPVAFSGSDGGEFRQPMAILVIGGLASSTLLTLLVVPVVYTAVEDARAAAARLAPLEALQRAVSALRECVRGHRIGGFFPSRGAPSASEAERRGTARNRWG